MLLGGRYQWTFETLYQALSPPIQATENEPRCVPGSFFTLTPPPKRLGRRLTFLYAKILDRHVIVMKYGSYFLSKDWAGLKRFVLIYSYVK